MNIHLKRAGMQDIPVLISIEKSVSGNKIYSAMLTEGEWHETLSKNTIYLIEKDNKIVGNISYELKNPAHAHIDGLAIMPLFQGQGIARQAMQLVLEELKAVQKIDLVTHPENTRAIKLYESLGFKVESRIENYFGDGEPRIKLVKNRD